MSRDERDTFLVILQISLFEQQNLIWDNSNVLTGEQETFGGGGIDGDADWESDSSHSDSSAGSESTSLSLEVLRIDGDHDGDTTAGETGDGDRLNVGWARPPGLADGGGVVTQGQGVPMELSIRYHHGGRFIVCTSGGYVPTDSSSEFVI